MAKKTFLFGLLVTVMLFGITVIGCSESAESLARRVQASMIEAASETGVNLRVIEDLYLIKRSNNEYTGYIVVSDGFRTQRQTVEVVTDHGGGLIWQVTTWQDIP